MKAFLTSLFNAIPYFHQFDINYSSSFPLSTLLLIANILRVIWPSLPPPSSEWKNSRVFYCYCSKNDYRYRRWHRGFEEERKDEKKINKLQLFNILFPLWNYVGCRATPYPPVIGVEISTLKNILFPTIVGALLPSSFPSHLKLSLIDIQLIHYENPLYFVWICVYTFHCILKKTS